MGLSRVFDEEGFLCDNAVMSVGRDYPQMLMRAMEGGGDIEG